MKMNNENEYLKKYLNMKNILIYEKYTNIF